MASDRHPSAARSSVSIRLLLTQSDARLVELARGGHERAFEALVQRYRRPLLAYCRRLLLPGERAEDALQQALLQAWLALQNGCEVREAKAWLYRIVHNAALNMLRVSGYDYAMLTETLRGADAPEQDLDRRIAVREALAGLAALPEMQREALLRTALDGHSHEQVARALGLSEGALRGLVYRARASLRAAATALTPSPAVNWALSQRASVSAPLADRLAELGAGGGSVGLGGLLLKGGAVVVTAGALAGGVAVVHQRPQPRTEDSATADLASAATGSGQGPTSAATPQNGDTPRISRPRGSRALLMARTSQPIVRRAHPRPPLAGGPAGVDRHGERLQAAEGDVQAGRPLTGEGEHKGLSGLTSDAMSSAGEDRSGDKGSGSTSLDSSGSTTKDSGSGGGGSGSTSGESGSTATSSNSTSGGSDGSSGSSGGSGSSSSGGSDGTSSASLDPLTEPTPTVEPAQTDK